MRRRLLRVITRLNVGGPARHALLLARALDEAWQTRIVTGTPPSAEGELTDARVDIARASLVRPVSPKNDARALYELRDQISRFRPALVHTHMAKAGAVGRVAAMTKRSRPVLVHTYHGHVLDGYFNRAVASGFLAMERLLAKSTDTLVAVSPQVRDELHGLGIGREDQWSVIPLGLDLTAHWGVTGHSGLLRDRIGIDDDVPLIGFVGRLVTIKAPSVMLNALSYVPDVHLAVVGDGELRAESESLALDLGIQDRVHFTGWQLDMPPVLADLDVIALSSRNEGTPLALIEAAACGVPAVATDVGGVRSIVEDGRTGVLVPRDDAKALGEAISRVVGDSTTRFQMGSAARETSRRYSAERLANDVSRLYEQLV